MTASEGELRAMATKVVEACRQAGTMIATAESCTGGLIAAFLTDVPGSSAVLDRGFVTYSNAAKAEMLGVDAAVIERHGAVSETVARCMAEGALARSRAGITIAVTGIAGPGGGSPEKPVGLVHFATASSGGTAHRELRFGDLGRDAIRHAGVAVAFEMLMEALRGQVAGETEAGGPLP